LSIIHDIGSPKSSTTTTTTCFAVGTEPFATAADTQAAKMAVIILKVLENGMEDTDELMGIAF
jgi:hypothetical protein